MLMAGSKVRTRFKQPRGRPHFIKEWREYRGLKQEQLAERIGKSVATVSQIESRKQDYTKTTLEAIADALMCEPADLVMRNPLDTEAPWSLWDQADTGKREQIISIMKVIVGGRDGTNG
ncbi:XRE family transcriptional regulator [Methylobacterium sp. DB1607]|nr:XRE family transcriptional regulator [Methylobacterium sp. DB1607]